MSYGLKAVMHERRLVSVRGKKMSIGIIVIVVLCLQSVCRLLFGPSFDRRDSNGHVIVCDG